MELGVLDEFLVQSYCCAVDGINDDCCFVGTKSWTHKLYANKMGDPSLYRRGTLLAVSHQKAIYEDGQKGMKYAYERCYSEE